MPLIRIPAVNLRRQNPIRFFNDQGQVRELPHLRLPEEEPQPPILLGLWGGLLEGRSLTRWPITERYDADIPTLENFGQWWRLADP